MNTLPGTDGRDSNPGKQGDNDQNSNTEKEHNSLEAATEDPTEHVLGGQRRENDRKDN